MPYDTCGCCFLLHPALMVYGQRGGHLGWRREGVPGLSAAQGSTGCGRLWPPLHQVSGDDGLACDVSWAQRAACCLASRSTKEVLLLRMLPVIVLCPTDPHMSRR